MAQPQAININEATDRILGLGSVQPETETAPVRDDEATETEVQDANAAPAPQEAPEIQEEPNQETPELTSEETTDEVEATAEEGEFISDLNAWLESRSRLDEIEVPIKVNGAEGKVKLADLVKDHQINKVSEERLNELKTEKQRFNSEKEQLLGNLNAQLSQAAELASVLETQFTKEFESVDWKELRESDPAEYSAKRQELQERQDQIKGVKEGIGQKQQEMIREHMERMIAEQSQRVAELIPEWSDGEKAKAEKSQLREYLLGTGFTPQEVDGVVDSHGNIQSIGIVDARAINLARKAMLYDQGSKKLDLVRKKVVKVPKVARPGKPQAKEDEDMVALQKQKQRLKKTGKMDDAASLISQLLR